MQESSGKSVHQTRENTGDRALLQVRIRGTATGVDLRSCWIKLDETNAVKVGFKATARRYSGSTA